MKKFLILLILISSFGFGQFTINGEIKNYTNKPVLIKINENGSERLVQRLETDKKGVFSYKFPLEYVGSLLFELSEGKFEMVSNNEHINFSTDIYDSSHKIYYQGGINQLITDYFALEDKKNLRDFTLVELLKLYKPEDAFYKAVQKEIDRINAIQQITVNSDAIKYYLETKTLLAEYNSGEMSGQSVMNDTKKHILNDNMYLENFGFLGGFLSNYISYSITGAKNREEATIKIENALDTLLDDVQRDTSRGQAILTSIIPMLEGNNFDAMAKKYLAQAESLTCEISDELRELIVGKSNIKEGEISPNIKFGKKIKGAKSLYDVKADKKLVIFWASWCPHCMKEMPFIKEFYTKFKEEGGEIIAVSLDLERKPFENVISDTGWINYSDFMKWDSPFVKTFGVTSTPKMILLDKDNKILKVGGRISSFITE